MISNEQKTKLIEYLNKAPIVQIACERVGISRATYYRWRKESKTFAKAADDALAEGSLLINDVAESQLMSAIKDKNLTAIIFWLKNHHPAYAERLEIKGRLTHAHEPLTDQQKKLITQALKLAGLHKQR